MILKRLSKSYRLIVLVIHISLFEFVYSDCPKICSVCLTKTLICENGGFVEFPTKFQSETENITLTGHHFHSNVLSRTNMTGILSNLKLKYLAIRACSIQEILSRTFSDLTYLETLDLSENQILNIHDFAFENLKLHILKLNDIGKLKLSQFSFSKLSLNILSIKNSRLSVLDYSVFAQINPILFKTLQLSNNNFRTIDLQFEAIIKNLNEIDLLGNPFVCNCSLLWLKMFYAANSLSSMKIIFPKCVSPSNVRGKLLSEIDEMEFKCELPKIVEINVNFISHLRAELFCKVDEKISKNGKTLVFWADNKKTKAILLSKSNNIASIIIDKSKFNINNYKCVAENQIGKSSILVSVNWPAALNILRPNLSKAADYPPPVENISWTTSFYFKKRYTLVELIVAIISTFVTTVLLFIITYKICMQNSGCAAFSDKQFISHQKLMNHQKGFCAGYPPFRFTTTDNGLHAAESNSQTYDCISINNALYPHQIPNTLPGPFIDYKTHERLYSPKLVVE